MKNLWLNIEKKKLLAFVLLLAILIQFNGNFIKISLASSLFAEETDTVSHTEINLRSDTTLSGTHMLNNRKNGKWLYSNGTTLQFRQGTFSQLEYGTPWVLQYVSSKDAYTIRWYGGTSSYLMGASSSANSSVS